MGMKKRLLALALAGVLTTGFSGCKKEEKVNLHNDIFDHYKYYTQTDIEGEELVNKYRGYSIVFAVNKETNELNEYIYYAGDAKNYLYEGITNVELLNKLGFIVEIFDLETGKLVYFNSDKNNDYTIGSENLNKLIEENDFYNLYDLYDLGVEYKEWYTIEEISEISKVVVDRNTKMKKLTRD